MSVGVGVSVRLIGSVSIGRGRVKMIGGVLSIGRCVCMVGVTVGRKCLYNR